jgi:hypothetical protein
LSKSGGKHFETPQNKKPVSVLSPVSEKGVFPDVFLLPLKKKLSILLVKKKSKL